MTVRPSAISAYRQLAAASSKASHVPFSNRPEAVVLVTEDGSWIPGVRVESATFSLTIPPLVNAATTAAALSVPPLRAVIASRALHSAEVTYARGMHLLSHLEQTAPDVLGTASELPVPTNRMSPLVDVPETSGRLDEQAVAVITRTREIARSAFVPASEYSVGCLLHTESGWVPGVNVEHDDWSHILCAERNALGTAVSYGLLPIDRVFVTCLRDTGCTPCGACRQLLAELAPASVLWMDRGKNPPASSDPVTLLPDFFSGSLLTKRT